MMKKYIITYQFIEPNYNQEWSGIFVCLSLEEVGAFTAMVDRYGGTYQCTI